jgi:hypothetical protein
MTKPNPHPHCPTCGKATILYAWRDLKPIKEDEAYRLRIKNLVAEFQLGGYDTYEEDLDLSVAIAQIMSVAGESGHMQRLLAHHMERITAASIAGLNPHSRGV